MTDDQYFKLELVSYSKLSNFDTVGPKSINNTVSVDRDVYALGSLTEDLIQIPDEIKDKYIITNNIKPTASLGILADQMVNTNSKSTIDNAVTLAKVLNLWANIKDDEKYISKIDIPQFWKYLKLTKDSRQIVSPDLYANAKAMANGVLNGQYTKDIFEVKEGEELIHQLAVIWNNGAMKSKLDFIKLDHNNKTITPYDLKTTGFPVEHFNSSFYKFRYYIQASMYYDSVMEWMSLLYSDYTLKPFQFVVVNKNTPEHPLVWTVSEQTLTQGRSGFNEGQYTGRKGYVELFEDYNWHVKHSKFDFKKSTYQANGLLTL